MSAVKFFILTSAQYAAIDPKDDGTLYFVSDQNRCTQPDRNHTGASQDTI